MMNAQDEIYQAMSDFRDGRLGAFVLAIRVIPDDPALFDTLAPTEFLPALDFASHHVKRPLPSLKHHD